MLTRKDLEKLEIGKDVLIDGLDDERIYYGITPDDRIFTYNNEIKADDSWDKKEWQPWRIKKKTKKVTLYRHWFVSTDNIIHYVDHQDEVVKSDTCDCTCCGYGFAGELKESEILKEFEIEVEE